MLNVLSVCQADQTSTFTLSSANQLLTSAWLNSACIRDRGGCVQQQGWLSKTNLRPETAPGCVSECVRAPLNETISAISTSFISSIVTKLYIFVFYEYFEWWWVICLTLLLSCFLIWPLLFTFSPPTHTHIHTPAYNLPKVISITFSSLRPCYPAHFAL